MLRAGDGESLALQSLWHGNRFQAPPSCPIPQQHNTPAQVAAGHAAPDFGMLPALKRGLPECEPMDPDQIARLDDASMSILEEVGVICRDDIALQDWHRAGADVRSDRVHLDRGLVRALISTIPSGWTYLARNPARSLPFGGKHSIFVPMTGAPFIRDLNNVRRWPTMADLNMFHKLSHMSPALHSTAHHIVEPMDMKVSHRHLHITYSSMKYSDKTFMGMTTSGKNAEALSALAYTQVIRKGAPAIYGHYLSTVSMKSGAPMAGTPEISLMNFMIGQMARFYNVPWRTSNLLGGAKTFDAQAGYESAMTMNAVLHAGANYIWHSAGWNEADMHCSVAKFVVDAEMGAMGYRMAEGPRWDDFDEAMRAVRDVGPGGHYLGHPHTLENFERAVFMPKLFDNNSIEQWQAEGSVEITQRALTRAQKLLNDYEEPKLDAGIDAALRDYIARREREIPAEDALNTEF